MNSTSPLIPQDFITNCQANYHQANELITALDAEPITSVRINRAKVNSNIQLEKVPWCNTGHYLQTRPLFTLDPWLHGGAYYVQEASSMFLEQIKQLTDTVQPLKILDLCAAPGGKTTHLLDLFPNSLIVSNEIIRNRAKILAENVVKWGNCNSIITNSEPSQLGKLHGLFDIILVDTPCSGEGMFRKDKAARTEWSNENVQTCYLRQRDIIQEILPALKEGGMLIYSTCTFNDQENDHNVTHFTQTFDLEIVKLPTLPDPQITETITGYQFYPHKTKGEGFFISFLKKQTPSSVLRTQSSRSSTLIKVKNDLLRPLITFKNKEMDHTHFISYNDMLYLFPMQYYDILTTLQGHVRILQFGTKIGKFLHNKLHPEHDISLCHQISLPGFDRINLSYDDALSYLRKNPFNLSQKKEGWCIVSFDNVSLGWVKAMQNRFNNYYPTDWRIYNQQLTGKFTLNE